MRFCTSPTARESVMTAGSRYLAFFVITTKEFTAPSQGEFGSAAPPLLIGA